MLRLDYSRNAGQWEPNEYGGNGNIEAIAFITDLNETLYRDFPDIQTIAEEATDWPKISKPTFDGVAWARDCGCRNLRGALGRAAHELMTLF